MEDEDEFLKAINIDPEALDVECLQQAELFWKWSSRATEARKELDQLKFELDVLEAELSLECRKHPARFGIEKVTEATIEAAVQAHEKLAKKTKEVIRARATSSFLDKAVDALEMKKRMLENLVSLHGQQYFATPSSPRNIGKIWRSMDRGTSEKLRTKIRPRKKSKR